jgi:hypothetical protein
MNPQPLTLTEFVQAIVDAGARPTTRIDYIDIFTPLRGSFTVSIDPKTGLLVVRDKFINPWVED